jgi:putative transposon-encoded protein
MTTKYNKISLDISFMRNIDLKPDEMSLSEEVELIFEKRVTPFGTSAKLDVPKKYRGWRAYVIIVKD